MDAPLLGYGSLEMFSNPQLSFSLDECCYESFTYPETEGDEETKAGRPINGNDEFEFQSSGKLMDDMTTADELFYKGKILTCRDREVSKQDKILLKKAEGGRPIMHPVGMFFDKEGDRRLEWLLDDGLSPRPPKCSLLLKELWRMTKHPSSLQQSSSSNSSSSSSSGSSSSRRMSSSGSSSSRRTSFSSSWRRLTAEIPQTDGRKERVRDNEKGKKKKKDEHEKTGFKLRLMPVGNVPIITGPRRSLSMP